ncbi:sulfurtransferase [Gryllotalpicola reticulitermitis]|uniref:Sulfurtransferase n=1 Tax=Gryllotalpicola reticulitermitis TaxID=1184153 RepID=A0ABV8Q2W8_9MICO
MQQPLFDGLPETPLVPTEWLADHLGADGLVVLDATVLTVDGFGGGRAYVSGEEQYLINGHIPGAVFADLFDDFSDPEGEYAFSRPGVRQFEREAQAHGIDNDTAVVVYDTNHGIWAARLWWLFKSLGFPVRVLDGGYRKWVAEGRPTQVGDVRPRRAGEFSAYEASDAWASKRDVEAVVAGDEDAVLLCALPTSDFLGASGARARGGHIPGSVSVPAHELTDRETGAYLPLGRLRELLEDVATAPDPIIAYCGSGIASAGDALALDLIGRDDVRIYDGSLSEWSADPAAPLETGEPGDRQLAAAGARLHRHSAAQQ